MICARNISRRVPAPARVGLEACGNSQWFVNLLQELGHAIWIGDAAQIRASYVRQQKTDKRDAMHILKLLLEDRFPRLWTPRPRRSATSGSCWCIATNWCACGHR